MVIHEEPTNIRVFGKYRVLNFHRVAILDSDTGTSIAIRGALASKNPLVNSNNRRLLLFLQQGRFVP